MEHKWEKIKDERMREIAPYIKDKIVLDIGCYAEIKEEVNKEKKLDTWIHGFLSKHAKHVVGIDIAKKEIGILKRQGYDVYCQSAEDFKLNKKFDVIFAGAVIEHLSNPGLFLDKCREHLEKDGWLIIDTPNVFCLNYKIGGMIRFLNNNLEVHPEHTCFYSPTTITNLMKRHGFIVKRIKFVNFNEINTFKRHLQDFLCKIFGDKLRYEMMLFAKLS